MATKIQLRRDTAANWTATDPILASGEMGFETDTNTLKAGDGATAWTSLPYTVIDYVDHVATTKAALGTATNQRYDKVLESTDIDEMIYTSGSLTTVRYENDGDVGSPYYRDVMAYTDGRLSSVSHFYNTADLVTASAVTTLNYLSDKLSSTTYVEA